MPVHCVGVRVPVHCVIVVLPNLPGVSRMKSQEVFFQVNPGKRLYRFYLAAARRFYSPGGEGWGQHG